jgi:hypothetical protein
VPQGRKDLRVLWVIRELWGRRGCKAYRV